ncbi:hypothetical protein BDR03DRAFT_986582 [Suillus americanus]|nr:hypothetical protein BDR03DRAFT_986582 [Suillus americanus]
MHERGNKSSQAEKVTKKEVKKSGSFSQRSTEQRSVNPATGVRIHKQNPKGVPCKNPVCNGLPRSLTHNCDHCLQPGGGMEGKAPWSQRSERGGSKKKDVAAAATETKTPATPTTSSSTETAALATHHRDWSCATVEELLPDSMPKPEDLACIASQTLSTILDSGTTSTLIMDKKYFWTYNTSDQVTVKTANHGKLITAARGDCVADLTVAGQTQRIRLSECLHAPGAMVNLFSIIEARTLATHQWWGT